MAKKTKFEKGQETCKALLEGKIYDFEEYVEDVMYSGQTIVAAYRLIGETVYEYISSLEDSSEKSQIVDKIFGTKNYTKITIFRVAQHIASKYSNYFPLTKKKRVSYLAIHHDVKETQFDMAFQLAGFSSLSKKFFDIKFTPSEYGLKVQNT